MLEEESNPVKRPRVYVETSVIGYLASRPSRDLITAANQQLTHDWWSDHRTRFELFVSQFVIDECSDGDAEAAQDRLKNLVGVGRLDAPEKVVNLAADLVREVPLPKNAEVDALHIAVAAVHGMDYLLTWNCTHIANASLRPRIVEICGVRGYGSPIICTPQELMES